MKVSGQLHAPAALPQGKSVPGTHWIGSRVGRSERGGEEKIPNHSRESNPRTPIVQPFSMHKKIFITTCDEVGIN
jgi:hypothetical protein